MIKYLDMKEMIPVPVVLFCFDRPWHTEQVLIALKANKLADRSHLIVYLDGPKKDATTEQIQRIKKVREVVKSESWCGSIEYHFAEENLGCRNSIIKGLTEVLNNYEAAIILEDDIITSTSFLLYMNKCLNNYFDYKSVFSVSGYNLPSKSVLIPEDYNFDVFVSGRQQNWGWGTWRDRWKLVNWDKEYLHEFFNNKYQVEALNRSGSDLSKMLICEYEGQSDAWDIQFTFAHFSHHAVSIIPCLSYTNNIGLDDSGTHTLNQNRTSFTNDLTRSIENPKLLDVLYEDRRIINAIYSFYYPKKRPLWKKVINRISRMLGGKNLFVIKKKVYC